MKLHRLTYSLLLFLFLAASISFAVRRGRVQDSAGINQESEIAKKATQRQHESDLRNNYPTVDFDEQESPDARKRAVQRVRRQRHNNAAIVSRVPSPKDKEVASLPEGLFDFPALPVEQSDLVVMADVFQTEAHMSEDKGNVYSEFELRLIEIYKSGEVKLAEGQSITAQRQGGYVKYPNNQKILYRIMKNGMPKLGSRYVLFLRAVPESNVFDVLTGYEIKSEEVSPMDLSAHFEAYRGVNEAEFLQVVREAVSRASRSQE